jgi:RNA polymerase sigma-70 factor (ECF subfamily)
VALLDDYGVAQATPKHLAEELVELYPRALPVVYGFLLGRCGDVGLAEDLTADTFVAAVGAVQAETAETITTAWLIVVARRRLVDYWRRQEVEQRHLRAVEQEANDVIDPSEGTLDVVVARRALAQLGPHHRAALTLRYLDGLPVADVAEHLGRSLHATEALLQRARAALRRIYLHGACDAD